MNWLNDERMTKLTIISVALAFVVMCASDCQARMVEARGVSICGHR